VVAIRNQCGAADLPADPDAEDGHGLVPDKPDNRGEHDGPQQPNGLRMEQSLPRFVEGYHRADRDGDDDDQTGQILDTPETVGEPPRGPPAYQQERDTEGDRGRCVGEVVDRVGQECHAAGEGHHHGLQERGDHQADE
jgi:hypothetical protein